VDNILGWWFVQRITKPESSGYVPASYLQKVMFRMKSSDSYYSYYSTASGSSSEKSLELFANNDLLVPFNSSFSHRSRSSTTASSISGKSTER